jgi:hypothetical protein
MAYARDLNAAIVVSIPDVLEDDPATWKHCPECHGDNAGDPDYDGPYCNHWIGCPTC